MKTRMLKAFSHNILAGTLASALALSVIAPMPAQAGSRDAEAVAAAGFIALLLGGIALSQQGRADPPRWTTNREAPRANRNKILPSECRRIVRNGPDKGRYFARKCLKREFPRFSALPRTCKERVERPNGRQFVGYRSRCLASFGFIADDRRRR